MSEDNENIKREMDNVISELERHDIKFNTNDNEYTVILESLTEDVLHTDSISDINDLLCGYEKLFP